MFKSIFAKYCISFMLIVLISFSVIILMISMIIGEHSKKEKGGRWEPSFMFSLDFLL